MLYFFVFNSFCMCKVLMVMVKVMVNGVKMVSVVVS